MCSSPFIAWHFCEMQCLGQVYFITGILWDCPHSRHFLRFFPNNSTHCEISFVFYNTPNFSTGAQELEIPRNIGLHKVNNKTPVLQLKMKFLNRCFCIHSTFHCDCVTYNRNISQCRSSLATVRL